MTVHQLALLTALCQRPFLIEPIERTIERVCAQQNVPLRVHRATDGPGRNYTDSWLNTNVAALWLGADMLSALEHIGAEIAEALGLWPSQVEVLVADGGLRVRVWL